MRQKTLKDLLGLKGTIPDDVNQFIEAFLYPFVMAASTRGHTVSNLLDMFFCTSTRHVFNTTAKREFVMPGLIFHGSALKAYGPRTIPKGMKLLGVLDTVTQTIKLETLTTKDSTCYLLKLHEFEMIKTKVDLSEFKIGRNRHRNDRS